MAVISLPQLEPRSYQLPFFEAMDRGIKRAVLVWHRRAGKDLASWNYMIREAATGRVGTYCYFFPNTRLGRRILWDGTDKDGKRFTDYCPKELIEGRPNAVEMKIRLTNGSVIQVVGTDAVINVGINPVGCTFSEFSLQSADAWNFVRPILRENGGWAIFNGTPRGKNHFWELFEMAKRNPEWYAQLLTVADTGVLTEADIQAERDEGMSEHLIRQEFYCEFNQGSEGAYYAKLLEQAEAGGRVGNVAYDPHALVDTYWDLGIGDSCAIIFAQSCGREVHIIDVHEVTGEGLQQHARTLKAKADANGWVYGTHYAPHDIKVRELGTGARTRLEVAGDLGIRFEVVPKIGVDEGIEMLRGLFPRLWIDSRCKRLLKALGHYQKVYNDKLDVFSDRPQHDWSSHIADAMRYLAVSHNVRSNTGRMSESDALAYERAYAARYI